MTFQEALKAVHESKGKLGARPKGRDDLGAIQWTDMQGWTWKTWTNCFKTYLPTPILLFGEWEVVECKS